MASVETANVEWFSSYKRGGSLFFQKMKRRPGKSSPVLSKFERLRHGSVAKRLQSWGLGHVRRRELNDTGAWASKDKSIGQ